MKKKFLSIILAIVMIIPCLFSFVSCGDDQGNANGGGNSNGNGSGDVGSEVTITFMVDDSEYKKISVVDGAFTMPENPTKTDLAFVGWYLDKDVWQEPFTTETEVTASVTVYAKFGEMLALNFYLGNNLYHTTTMSGSSAITLPTEPSIPDYKFEGWYLLNVYTGNMTTTKLTEDYFVSNPSTGSKNVKAKLTLLTKDNSQTGTYRIDGNYLYMGEYPSTLKESNVSITSQTPDENGYFLGSDGNRYAKVESAVLSSEMTLGWFSDEETQIKNGETYYFKVEEVKWRIIEKDDDTALIHTDKILFTHVWDDKDYSASEYPDYATSAVHNYLNTTVYNSLFSEEEKAVILTSWVDNGNEEIGWGLSNTPSPWMDCASKLFLPSFKSLGEKKITTGDMRRLYVSDYLRAQGVTTYEYNYKNGYGYFWGRTKDALVQRNFVMYATPESSYGAWHVKNEFGVVPMLRIDL